MKRNSFFGMLSAVAVVFTSCNDFDGAQMRTIVNNDGSCTREVSYSQRKSQPQGLSFGSQWQSRTEVGQNDSALTVYSREFSSVEELSTDMPLLYDGEPLKAQSSLEKRFRWFYTEYVFSERFACLDGVFKLPPTDYADSDEVGYWFTGQPNIVQGLNGAEASMKIASLDHKFDRWISDNLILTCIEYIESHYDSIDNPPVGRAEFAQLRDSLAQFCHVMCEEWSDRVVQPTDLLREFFHSDAYAFFFDEKSPCAQELNSVCKKQMRLLDMAMPYSLVMPGEVTDAGTGTYTGTEVQYALTGDRLIPADYCIGATSRVTNVWAYVVTVLVILFPILAKFFGRYK